MIDVDSFLRRAEEKFASPITLGTGILFCIILFTLIDGFIEKFINAVNIRGLLYLLITAIWIGAWIRNRFILPRNKKNRIGIVIAIFSESEIERQRLKADFIAELKRNIIQEGVLNFAEVIFLKNHFAKRIVESNSPIDDIRKMNRRLRSHFYVWGNIKKRPDGEIGEKYFLSFQGYVTHKPIRKELKEELARDFSAVLPKEISFSERDFRGFEVSAAIVHLAARYIIGVAAFVSQDPRLAFKLHNGLREQFNMYRPLPHHLQNIRAKIPLLLSEEALWIARWHQENGRITECKELLQKSLQENPRNYAAWLRKAVLDFHDGNVPEAFASIQKAEQFAGQRGEWRYSKAFLYFWSGEYQKAMKQCQKIKGRSYLGEDGTCDEVRKFNLDILSSNTEKPQLYFWLGFISYFKKNNLAEAHSDFEKFEELAESAHSSLRSKSTAYLLEIRRKMSLPSIPSDQ